MSLVSMQFFTFIAVALIGYYLIPKRFQWIWLLLFSYVYYISYGIKYVFFILYTTCVTYFLALLIYCIGKKIDDNNKKSIEHKKRMVIIIALLLEFGVLAVLKYTNFVIENINSIFNSDISMMKLILPIGISFYTFQSVGYVLDVYWERCRPEKNFLKLALFVSFFPQIMQGPIGRYSNLAHQLYDSHSFNVYNIERGMQRILWGLFKKLVIADNAALFVNPIFDNYRDYDGLAILGVLAYSAQLYGDFSGAMDIVIGIAQMFGIKMDENFQRPYFSISITDFWHRWHITLGTWMKDYVFYPLTFSGWMSKLGKFCKKRVGKVHGRAIPVCIANIIVFLVVGIWHGAAWKYIVYGLYNGLIIGISGVLASEYRRWKNKLNIDDKSNKWRIVQIIRTFILVNISWFFDRADTITQAFIMMKNAFTKWKPSQIMTIEISTSGIKYTIMSLAIVFIGCAIVFAVSFCQEKGMHVRESISKRPMIVRWGLYVVMIISLSALGVTPRLSGGFIYAQF